MKGTVIEMRKFTNKYFGGVYTLVYVDRNCVELMPEGSHRVFKVSLQRFIMEFEECLGSV